MKRNDGWSDQCRSSTATKTGCSSARLAVSQYKPWSTANASSSTPINSELAPRAGAASPAAPLSSPSSANPPRSNRSNSYGPRPRRSPPRTRRPEPRARSSPPVPASTGMSSRLVLPIPATPSTISAPPVPARADSSAATIWASSASRSSRSVIAALAIPGRLDRRSRRRFGDEPRSILSVFGPRLFGDLRDAPAAPASDDEDMSGARRLVQTLELVVSGDTIEGRLRPEQGPSRYFSGWSELFALLQSITSEFGHPQGSERAQTEDGSG